MLCGLSGLLGKRSEDLLVNEYEYENITNFGLIYGSVAKSFLLDVTW